MTLELQVLGWAVVLAAVQLVLYAIPANMQLGVDYTAGPRDERRELSGRAARLERAFRNHVEGLALFTPAVVVVVAADAASAFTGACAVTYLVARLVYVPCYALGVRFLRSIVWAVGFFATLLMLLAALL